MTSFTTCCWLPFHAQAYTEVQNKCLNDKRHSNTPCTNHSGTPGHYSSIIPGFKEFQEFSSCPSLVGTHANHRPPRWAKMLVMGQTWPIFLQHQSHTKVRLLGNDGTICHLWGLQFQSSAIRSLLFSLGCQISAATMKVQRIEHFFIPRVGKFDAFVFLLRNTLLLQWD